MISRLERDVCGRFHVTFSTLDFDIKSALFKQFDKTIADMKYFNEHRRLKYRLYCLCNGNQIFLFPRLSLSTQSH